MTVIIVILVASTLYSDARRRFNFNVLFRVFMNHVQLMVLTISFKFDWPESIESTFSWWKPIANISGRVMSLDCMFDTSHDFPVFYYKLMLMAALPWILLASAWIFWSLVAYCKGRTIDKENRKLEYIELHSTAKSRTIITQFIIMFVVYPNILSTMFTMVN